VLDQLKDATDGALVYLAMLGAGFYVVVANFEKVGGVFFKIAERRRVAAAERQGADITLMKRQIKYLTEEVEGARLDLLAARQELRRSNEELIDFEEWAHAVQIATARSGVIIPDPPGHQS